MKNIKQWYLSTYKEDKELGNQISESATFEGLELNIPNVYDYINVLDSIVRERVFSELAERIGATYEYVYNEWRNN